MKPHPIRLRRPWHCEQTEGGLMWRRRFGRPSGLTPDHRVELIIEGLPAKASVALNGELLAGQTEAVLGQTRFDVTRRLLARNELAILLPVLEAHQPDSTGTPPVLVRLEISPA